MVFTCGYDIFVDNIPEGEKIVVEVTNDNLAEGYDVAKLTIIKGDIIHLIERGEFNKKSFYLIKKSEYLGSKWKLTLQKMDENVLM